MAAIANMLDLAISQPRSVDIYISSPQTAQYLDDIFMIILNYLTLSKLLFILSMSQAQMITQAKLKTNIMMSAVS